MKGYGNLARLLLVLSVLMLAATSTVGAGIATSAERAAQAAGEGPWGPRLDPLPDEAPVVLEPMPIPAEMRAANATIVSDDFNRCDLNTDLWTFIDPVGDAQRAVSGSFTDDALFSIAVPADVSHNIWEDGNFAPRIMQAVDDTDFELEVKFQSGVEDKYQMLGLLAEQDASHFLRFEFYSTYTETMVFAASFAPGTTHPLKATVYVQTPITYAGRAPLWMRVQRAAGHWTQYYSTNGTTWKKAVEFDLPLQIHNVGTYAANCCEGYAPSHTGYIDYFFNRAAPIVPEDGDRNTLTVSAAPPGTGSVTKVPDRGTGSYACQEQVTLTANPAGGWAFGNWSGGLTGSQNPAIINMNGSRTIAANFIESDVTLSMLAPIGQGTVTPAVGNHIYTLGQKATLTATPAAGWVLGSWGGANGPEVVDKGGGTYELLMNGNKQVQAIFIQPQWTLTILPVEGKGTATKVPDQPTYSQNQVVKLVPQPECGWKISGWVGPNGGDVQDNGDGTWSVTMNGNKTIQPSFSVDLPSLTINKMGRGQVTVDLPPVQPGPPPRYLCGDVLTLTPNPDPTWVFSGWGGPDGSDVVLVSGKWQLTMDGHKEVTAKFGATRIFLPLVVRKQ